MKQAEDTVAVSLRQVSRRFGHRQVLQDVSLSIPPGEVLLLMGKNGAGKTTLLRLIAGLLKPTSGRIEVHGSVAMVGHSTMLYDALTARENLAFFARLHGLSPARVVDAALDRVGLQAAMDQRIATYSRGMLQRLTIARALLPTPDVLLLDEPLSGLDEVGSRIVLTVLSEVRARGCAIVIATHQIAELTPLGSRVGYLFQGRLAEVEPLEGRDAASVMDRYRTLISGSA